MEEKNIQTINISKKFNIGYKKNESALEKMVSFVSGKEAKKEIEVLNNISFDAFPGETIGIIGKNGSGKTTLLRILAGIYQPDKGEVKIKGRLYYLSGFNNGLIPKLTMEENIYLMGSIMGLNQKDIKKRLEEIVGFSGLEDFVYTKVCQFSTGMTARLAFSTTIHCLEFLRPDILLFDEVFNAGGDIDFQSKATGKMEEVISKGATVILVSHALNMIEKHCGRTILLNEGKIIADGNSKETIESYLKTLKAI